MLSMWAGTDDKGFKASCDYDAKENEFEVTVQRGTCIARKRFKANFEPRFGMDVLDHNISFETADKLAITVEELEKKNIGTDAEVKKAEKSAEGESHGGKT